MTREEGRYVTTGEQDPAVRTQVAPGEVARQELKFQRLAEDLQRGIIDGTYPPGSKLPTDQALAAETRLSLTTVRRAYDELAAKGLVERRQGAGTFVARRPERRSSGVTVGVLVPETTSYYPRVLQGVERALARAHARLILACSHYDRAAEEAAIDSLLEGGADGLLLVPTIHDLANPSQRFEELDALPVPVVLMERRMPDKNPADRTFHVCTNHEAGGYDSVRHLAGLGHTRVALVRRSDGPTGPGVQRGWEQAREQLGLEDAPVISAPRSDWLPTRADAAVDQLRESGVSAVVCFGDREALLLVAAANRRGMKVPDELAIVSYDNDIADLAEVPLTAVSPAKFRLGRLAADLIIRRITEGAALPPHQIVLCPPLVVRASCGARPGSRPDPDVTELSAAGG